MVQDPGLVEHDLILNRAIDDRTLYADHRILITATHAAIGGAILPIANLSSVRLERDLNIVFSLVVLAAVVMTILTAVAGFFGFANPRLGSQQWLYPVGIVISLLLVLYFFRRFKLTLTTNARETEIITSGDYRYLTRIKVALLQAINAQFMRVTDA